MEIVLQNFRCYKEKTTITIIQGVTLIKGKSGSGKTTIIEAILYALYGKIRKPYTIGEKRCSVTLKITDSFKIFRQSGPGKIKLTIDGVTHDGAEAQAAINGVYGNYEFFVASTYLKQGQRSPLFSGSNSEKMALIRNLSFKEDNVDGIQKKVKLRMKELEGDTSRLHYDEQSKQKVVNSFKDEYKALKKFQNDNPEVDFSELDIDNLNEKAVSTGKQVKELQQQLHNTLQLESAIQTLNGKITEKIDIIKIEKDIEEIDSKIVSNRSKINQIKEFEAQKKASRKLIELKEKKEKIFNEIKSQHQSLLEKLGIEKNKEGEEILDRLKKNQKKNEEINLVLKDIGIQDAKDIREKLIEVTANVEQLNRGIMDIETSIDNIAWNKKQNETLTCPKCNSALAFREEKLALVKEDFKPNIRHVSIPNADKKMLESVNDNKYKQHSLKEKFKESQSNINRLRRDLDKHRPGEEELIPTYENFVDIIPKMERAKKDFEEVSDVGEIKLENNNENTTDEEEILLKEIKTLEESRREKQRIVDKEKEQKITRQELEKLKEQLGDANSEAIKVNIEKDEKAKARLEEISKMASNFGKNQEFEKDAQEAKIAHEISEKKYLATSKLYDVAKQVEIKILQSTVNSLNLEMEQYLNILFPDSPITVKFRTTKNLKSGKKDERMACSLEIFYKNTKYDDVSQLSGGEADRISLAKTLAMNNISGSGYLFLDESLNALDSELKFSVVELLKDFCRDSKTCIVISHEGVEGTYHNLLDLDVSPDKKINGKK